MTIPHNKISLLDSYTSYIVFIFIHLFLTNIIMSYQNFYYGANDGEDNKGDKNLITFFKFFFKFKNIIKFNFGYINLDEYEPEKNENKIEMENTNKESENNNIDNSNIDNINVNDNNNIKKYHEKLNEHQFQYLISKKCLTIHNISKSFRDVLAVNNFKGNLFPSEIFCLLGHNGAGKTTLIKIISGVEKPDKGDIYLFGNSILRNKDFLYRNIGVCDQENNFFDYLTVYEHLKYLTEIKHNTYFLSPDTISEIKTLITKLGLDEKKDSLADTLSAGQK
jgi:ABC-type glutathione transport system ATPase component